MQAVNPDQQQSGASEPARLASLDEIVDEYCVASNPIKGKIYFVLGLLFIVFAVIGIWVPGWPTASWAVPAAFFFSMSSERLFRWTLTNRFFGKAMFDYYATGKSLPKHAKYGIVALIGIMATASTLFVWRISVRGDGTLMDPGSWNGADPGFGPVVIFVVGLIGIWYVGYRIPTRRT